MSVSTICLHEIMSTKMKRSRTAFVFTLTSFITLKRNMMKILFLQQSSLVQAYRRLQAKSNKRFKYCASPKGLHFSSKFKRKKGGGESPLLKMKLNEYFFCNRYCLVLIRDKKKLRKRIKKYILFCLVP